MAFVRADGARRQIVETQQALLSDLEQLEVEDFAEELPAEATSVCSIELLGRRANLAGCAFSAELLGPRTCNRRADDAVYVISSDDFAELDLNIDDVAQAPKKPAAPAASSEEDPDDGGADSP